MKGGGDRLTGQAIYSLAKRQPAKIPSNEPDPMTKNAVMRPMCSPRIQPKYPPTLMPTKMQVFMDSSLKHTLGRVQGRSSAKACKKAQMTAITETISRSTKPEPVIHDPRKLAISRV